MTGGACLIVGACPQAGAEEFYRTLLGEYPTVVAADAAGEWCADLGRVPDAVIGDFDSSRDGALARLSALDVEVVRLPVAKNESDLDACLSFARHSGVEAVDFCAAFVGRPDHTLAAFGTLLAAADLKACVREPDWSAWALDAASRPLLELDLAAGTTFSVLSPGGAKCVSIEGATFPLSHAALPGLSSLGVSNVAVGGTVRVAVETGAVLVLVVCAHG